MIATEANQAAAAAMLDKRWRDRQERWRAPGELFRPEEFGVEPMAGADERRARNYDSDGTSDCAMAAAAGPGPPEVEAPMASIRSANVLLTPVARPLHNPTGGGGENFEGGDFDGENPDHYERALDWATDELNRREQARIERARGK